MENPTVGAASMRNYRPDMLNSLRMLVEDLRVKARWNYKDESLASMAKVLSTDGTASMVLYRLMQGSRELGLGPLEMVFNKLNAAFGNAIIGRGADFGPGFVLFHSIGVVINKNVRGGSNIRLHHEVTIGEDEEGNAPVLGSDIDIGAGAKIIGGVTIGDGVRIGANAVVVHDVPAGATVVGIPAKPVRMRPVGGQPGTGDASADSRADGNADG
jgi:serine O-acetyltransferase